MSDLIQNIKNDLQSRVNAIADTITHFQSSNPEDYCDDWEYLTDEEKQEYQLSGSDYLHYYSYDIRYVVSQQGYYVSALIQVAGGGPNIWVRTGDNSVTGYWGEHTARCYFADIIGLDDACEEMAVSTGIAKHY